MIISFGLMTTMTMYLRQLLSKKSKKKKSTISITFPAWFPRDFVDAHLLVQGFAVIISLIGFNIVYFNKEKHFESLHSWLGGATMLTFGLFLPFTGFGFDESFSKETQNKIVNLHRVVGTFIWRISFVVILSGILKLYSIYNSTS